jgi:hypothetical protein
MVATLIVLVFPPLYHPNAQLVFLTGADYHPLRAPPAAYALEDFGALESLDKVLDRHGAEPGPLLLGQMRSAGAMRTLSEDLSGSTPESAGALIVYVDGHGVSDNGTAYLLCRNYDPSNPVAGRYRLHDLLHQLSGSAAAVKLLILDTGRIEADPRMGMLINEFPRLLQQEVEQTGDQNLWVLTSNAILERSHVSPALERSVFGYFVALGLRGAADLNADKAIDVDELYRYVRANVSAWVRTATAGHETQTPLLLWGGGSNLNPPHSLPVLLPVSMPAGGRPGLKLPAASAKFPEVGGGIASPYTNRATQDFVPVAAKSQKKVPGLKQTRKAAKTNAKVSRRIDASKEKQATESPKAGAPGPAKAEPSAPSNEKSGASAEGKSAGNENKEPGSSGDGQAAPVEKEGAGPDAADETAAKSSQGKPRAPSPPPTAGGLLAQAWQLRDDMESPGDEPRALDYAPQTWHEYQQWLLAEEQLYRAGDVSDPKEIAASLTKALARLAVVPTPPPLDKDQPPDLASRISALRPQLPDGVDAPWSLAMAQFFSQRSRAAMSPEAIDAARALDRFATDGTPAEFAAWIKKLGPALDGFSEARWARQLSKLQGLDWPVVQLALATRQLGEQVVIISPTTLPWIRERLEAADRLRLSGERRLTDAIGTDRQAIATRLFRQATDLYHESADDIAVVSGATQLRNDLMNRAPFYVAWREAAGWEPPAEAPKDADLVALFDRLSELDATLAAADPVQLEHVNKLAAELATLADRIESGSAEANVANLAGPAPGVGSGWRIELLLSTPLLSAESRERLLAVAADSEAKQAANYRPANVDSVFDPIPGATPARWQAIVERAETEMALARLAAGRGPDASRLLDPLQDAAAELKAAEQRRAESGQSAAIELDEPLWLACRKFGGALQDFYHNLPGQVETLVAQQSDLTDAGKRPARISALRSAARMLRLADVRDQAQSASANPAAPLAAASLYDLLVWQNQRLQASLADAPPADVGYLADAAASYSAQADRIPLQPATSPAALPPLAVNGSTAINLTTEPEQLVELSLHSSSAEPTDVWIVCRYSPELLDVLAVGASNVYHDHLLRATTKNSTGMPSDQDTVRPDRLSLPATFQVRAGGTEPLRLKVRSKAGARQTTRLIVQAISAGAFVRHETDVALPAPQTIELAVEGAPGTWTQSDAQVSLFPFPNRKTGYRFSLINNGLTDRSVDIEFLALDARSSVSPPAAGLAEEDAARMMARFGPMRSVAVLTKVSVPAGAKPVPLPFPVPDEKKAAEPAKPQAKLTATASAAPASKAATADEPPAPPRPVLDRGFLVVVTDRETQLKTITRIDIEPQRPRRYVRPQVGYNLDRETLQIRVVPQDKALLPPDGVHVHADIATPLPPGTQAQLDADVKAPDYVANLFCELPADAAKVVTVRLTVDGYPRAFVYHVPCGIQSSDLAEETDLREVRILSPAAETAYRAPIDSIPVDAEVDAPLGAFQNPDDVLEIGIDVDRDRDLRGEPSVRLAADRQVNIWLDRAGPGGLISLDSNVGDFHLTVPTPALRNARVDVLGRVFSAGKTGWSEPVEILLDGTPPRVERVELLPTPVVIGPDVEASIWATDDNLSGVVKIEVGFDTSGHGKFDDTVEPFELTRDATGRWFGKIPTKPLDPGTLTFLIRATDRAGNVSDYTKVKARIITKAEADAAAEAPNARLQGTVLFGNDPVPAAEMTISSEKGPKISPITTDDRGNFTFAGLPPGKYKLAAKAVLHNKTRKMELDVTVESASANPRPVRVILK